MAGNGNPSPARDAAAPSDVTTDTSMSGLRLSERWNDALLDEMRRRGDPPADRVIEALLADRELEEARRLLRLLIENDSPPPEGLPPEVLEYLRESEHLAGSELDAIDAGQEVFEDHGPLILMCLACYSLPAAYAAEKGVKVLHQTAYLEKRPAKRLFETTQMVLDVMTPGGLERGGRGVRTAQKVRLMHAMVRHMLRHRPDWPSELGVPINQEDLAGTLMTFSWITFDGLRRLGVDVPPAAAESYLAAWRAVGRLMGVAEELIPESIADAELLTKRIQSRQIAPSDEGRLLTQALLEMLMRNGGFGPFRAAPAAMMRHFLPAHVADFLGVPKNNVAHAVVDFIAGLQRRFEHFPPFAWLMRALARYISHSVVQRILNVGLGGKSAPFDIPTKLRRHWHLNPVTEPTLLQRFAQWLRRCIYTLFGGAH